MNFRIYLLTFPLVVSLCGCAGREEAEKTSATLADVLAKQSKQHDQYATIMKEFIDGTRQLAADNVAITERRRAEVDQFVSGLDLTGKGPGTDIYRKHTAVGVDSIVGDTLLSDAQKPYALPPADPDFEKAISALKPIAAGETPEDQLSFFIGLTVDAKAAWDAQQKANDEGAASVPK